MRADTAERLLLGPDRQPGRRLVRVLQSQGILFRRKTRPDQFLAWSSLQESVLLTLRWLSYLRGIDSRDYRRRRVPLHCFTCSALRLDDGRPGTCEPHPSPPSQVNSCYHVPVHHYSTATTPELAFQSF